MYDHVGLKVRYLDVSLRFYEAVLAALGAAAGRDNGAPELRADYGPTCYAAFLIDQGPCGFGNPPICFGQSSCGTARRTG